MYSEEQIALAASPMAISKGIVSSLLRVVIFLGSLASSYAAAAIAIDIGHSIAAPGATSTHGVREFYINRQLAREIEKHINAAGTRTVLIGDHGSLTSLTERTRLAQQRNATFFLSVHHDSAQTQFLKEWQWEGVTRKYTDDFAGFSLFVSRKNAQLRRSLRCASEIGRQLKQRGFRPSSHHAMDVPGERREWADKVGGVLYFDDLIVLKSAKSPAVLLEAGVIANRRESIALTDTFTQATIAAAVTAGLRRCRAI